MFIHTCIHIYTIMHHCIFITSGNQNVSLIIIIHIYIFSNRTRMECMSLVLECKGSILGLVSDRRSCSLIFGNRFLQFTQILPHVSVEYLTGTQYTTHDGSEEPTTENVLACKYEDIVTLNREIRKDSNNLPIVNLFTDLETTAQMILLSICFMIQELGAGSLSVSKKFIYGHPCFIEIEEEVSPCGCGWHPSN